MPETPAVSNQRLPVLLAAVGLLASIALEVAHFQAYASPSATSFCSAGARFDCTAVALHPASVLLKIPLPVWGIAGFLAMLLAARRRSHLLVPLSGIAALASAVLLGIELFVVGSLCLLCEVVHGASFALFAVAWRRRSALPLSTRQSRQVVLGPPAAVLIGSFAVLPSYWAYYSWRTEIRIPHGVGADGRPWIGSESPKTVVHEYVDYACPHCAVSASRMAHLVAEHASSLRLVRHHYPRMKCPRIEPFAHCEFARVALCAGDQGKAWQMDSWLFEHVPSRLRMDYAEAARDVGLDEATLRTCATSERTFERAQAEATAAAEAHIIDAPSYVLDGKRYVGGAVFEELRKRL